jgi:pimeloyl-ACP methyl ester carboxylesterase
LTFSRRTWQPVVDLLSDRFRCITVDLPAHGDTAGSPAPLQEVAERVHSSVVDLGAEPPVVVGHSMAALIATLYAASFRGPRRRECRPVAARRQVRAAGAAAGAGATRGLRPCLRPLPRRHRGRSPARARPAQTLSTQTVEQDVVLGYWGEVVDSGADVLQSIVTGALQAIRAPYLAVMGHQVPEDERDYMQANLRDLLIEEWDGQGHLLHLVDPERFAARVAAFIDDELPSR